MKKNKKHRFAHPDPEKASSPAHTIETMPKSRYDRNPITAKDLRRVIYTILFFTVILTVFYYFNNRYNLLIKFNELITF